jgi:hypothetical protein
MSTATVAHGTRREYLRGCRCDDCKADNSRYLADYRARNPPKYGAHEKAKAYEAQQRRIERGLAADDSRHGTAIGYRNWGCRCDRCRTAATQKRYAEKAKAAAKQGESC